MAGLSGQRGIATPAGMRMAAPAEGGLRRGTRWRRRRDVLAKQGLERRARDEPRAEACEMARWQLTVDHGDRLDAAELDETGEGHVRGVPLPAEHRLAEEHASEPHSVESSREPAVEPRLHAVRVALAVQLDVGGPHLWGDPRARARLAGRRAAFDDRGEVMIDPGLEAAIAQRLREAAGAAEIFRKQHRARIWRPPEHRLARRVPGEDAAAVGCEQPGG